jgi:exonuclease III
MMQVLIYRHITTLVQTEQIKKAGGGGVGIYIAKQLKCKIRKDLNTNIEETMESVFIEISISTGKNIIVGVIYRPPNNKIENIKIK